MRTLRHFRAFGYVTGMPTDSSSLIPGLRSWRQVRHWLSMHDEKMGKACVRSASPVRESEDAENASRFREFDNPMHGGDGNRDSLFRIVRIVQLHPGPTPDVHSTGRHQFVLPPTKNRSGRRLGRPVAARCLISTPCTPHSLPSIKARLPYAQSRSIDAERRGLS